MIQAFHSNWTAPFFRANPDKNYYIDDFEILSTILSALKWREKNGSIKMVTDKIGARYYRSLGIDCIWDLGIDLSLEDISDKIDSNIFWAAGKLYALKNQNIPCVMIDTDFIVWESIEDILKETQVSVIHKENIVSDVYPSKEYFKVRDTYKFNNMWDWTVLPSNTAFTYINNREFKDYYVSSAIEFMENIKYSEDKITNMVFAEQRLISMCAKFKNVEINEIMKLESLFHGKQDLFTHIWGYKKEMRNDFNKRKSFCKRCIRRIINDFPQYEDMISNINQLQYYYNELN